MYKEWKEDFQKPGSVLYAFKYSFASISLNSSKANIEKNN